MRFWPAVTVKLVGGGPNPAMFTLSINALDVLVSEFPSPSKRAVMECDATPSADVIRVATALVLSVPVPMGELPSRNVTVPTGAIPAVVTVAVNVMDWPPMIGFCEDASAVDVVRGAIVSASGEELLGAKFESPEYCATIESAPAGNDEIFSAACPAFNADVPSKTPLLKKLALPDGVPGAVVAMLLTVAVRVTGCPKIEVAAPEPSDVLVPAVPGGMTVVKIAWRAVPP